MQDFFGYSKMLLDQGATEIVEAFNDEDIYVNTGLELSDSKFYYNKAIENKGMVLELGCGYGRILLNLLEKGIPIDGLEQAPNLAHIVIKEAKKKKLNTHIYIQDMKNVGQINLKYNLIICPNYVMDYISSYHEFINLLISIKSILNTNGKLIFNIDIKDKNEREYGPALSKIQYNKESGKIYTSIIQTKVLNEDFRLCNLTTFISKDSYTQTYVSCTKEFRWDYEKMLDCIKMADFDIENIYCDYNENEFSIQNDDECIIVLTKK